MINYSLTGLGYENRDACNFCLGDNHPIPKCLHSHNEIGFCAAWEIENRSCVTCTYFVPDKKKPERGLCFGNKARVKGSCSQWKVKKCTVIPK